MSQRIQSLEEISELINDIDLSINIISMICFNSYEDLENLQLLKKYFKTSNNGKIIAFEHIFVGEQTSSGIYGYHSEFFFKDKYVQNNLNANKSLNKEKPYDLVLPSGKSTSCFPINMNATQIIITILKAYKQAWLSQPPKSLTATDWDPCIFSNDLNTYLNLNTGEEQYIYNAYPRLH